MTYGLTSASLRELLSLALNPVGAGIVAGGIAWGVNPNSVGGDATAEDLVLWDALNKARAAVKAKEKTKEDPTMIYRYTNKFDYQSLTPAPADAIVMRKGVPQPKGVDDLTLSFSTNPGIGWSTTMEAINATGILMVIKDSTNHVSIIPNPVTALKFGSMDDWRNSFKSANAEPHLYTQILYYLSAATK